MKKTKKKSKIIPILSIILGVLIVIGIGIFVLKNNEKAKQISDNQVEQSIEVIEDANDKKKPKEVELYEVNTDYCKLYFPESWKDQIEVKYTDEAGYKAEFYGLAEGKEETHLFDVCFNSDDGYLLGSLKNGDEIINISIDMKEVEFDDTWTQEEVDQIYAMQEDMNFLVAALSENENYIEQ